MVGRQNFLYFLKSLELSICWAYRIWGTCSCRWRRMRGSELNWEKVRPFQKVLGNAPWRKSRSHFAFKFNFITARDTMWDDRGFFLFSPITHIHNTTQKNMIGKATKGRAQSGQRSEVKKKRLSTHWVLEKEIINRVWFHSQDNKPLTSKQPNPTQPNPNLRINRLHSTRSPRRVWSNRIRTSLCAAYWALHWPLGNQTQKQNLSVESGPVQWYFQNRTPNMQIIIIIIVII